MPEYKGYRGKDKKYSEYRKSSRAAYNKSIEDELLAREAANAKAKAVEQEKKKQATKGKSFFDNAANFAQESNKFIGRRAGDIQQGTTWLLGKAMGLDDESINSAIKTNRQKVGDVDENGLTVKEKYKGNILEDIGKKAGGQKDFSSSFMTEEEQAAEKYKNENEGWSKAGKIAGQVQDVAVDLGTMVIPGAAAEKAIRAGSFAQKLAKGGKLAKGSLEVGASVGGGLASTAAGLASDPGKVYNDLKDGKLGAEVGGNMALDAAIGALSPVAGKLIGKAFNAVKGGSKTVEEAAADVAKNSDLTEKEAMEIINKAHGDDPRFQLPEMSQKTVGEQGDRLRDIDSSLKAIDNGDIKYMEDNNLLNKELGDKRFKELTTENPEFVKASQEAAKVLREADDQVKYYNDIKTSSKYFRQVDSMEQARKAELDRLGAMADDPSIPADRVDIESLVDDVNRKWDTKLEELSKKYPEEAAQKPMLDNAIQQATMAKMDAEDGLNQLVQSSREAAFKEANSVAMTPNKDKLVAHRNELLNEQKQIAEKLQAAKNRADNPNKSVADVDDEIAALQDGTHPLRTSGAPAKEVRTKFRELQEEKTTRANQAVLDKAESDPSIPVPKDLKDGAIEQVGKEIQIPTKDLTPVIHAFQTPNRVLTRIGLPNLAKTIEDAFDNYRRAQSTVGERIIDIQTKSKLKGSSLERVVDALDGKDVENMTAGELTAANELRALFKEYADRLGLPEEKRISNYFPHMFEQSGKEPVVPIELSDILVKNAKVKTKAGFIDNSRLANKENYIKDPFKVAAAYAKQAERRIHMQPAFDEMNKYIGNKNIDQRISEYIQKYGKHMMGHQGVIDRSVNQFADSVLNMFPKVNVTNSGTKTIGAVRGAAYRANLQMNPGTAIRNLTQGVNTVAEIGATRWTQGTLQLLRELGPDVKGTSKAFNEMRDMGLFDDSFHQHGEIKMVKKAFDRMDKAGWRMFQLTEKINRGGAYLGAKAKYLAKHPDDIEGAKEYAAGVVSKTQFHFNDMELPPVLRSKTMRGLAQYQSFNIKQAEYLADMFGGGAKEVKMLMEGKIKPRDMENAIKAMRWSAANMAMVATLGSFLGYKFTDAIPNPTDPRTFGSPMMQLMFGDNKSKDGIEDAIMGTTKNTFYKYTDSEGNEVSREEFDAAPELYEATKITDKNELKLKALENVLTKTMPGIVIPWFTQGKKTVDSLGVSGRGYSETDNGSIRYMAEGRSADEVTKGAIFGESTMDESRAFYDNKDNQNLSKQDSQEVKDAPKEMRKMYYDFFTAADKVTGRSKANEEITNLYRSGQVQRARDKAAEHNAKVDAKLADFFSKYEYIDPDLEEKLNDKLYIKITSRGEKSRSRSDD